MKKFISIFSGILILMMNMSVVYADSAVISVTDAEIYIDEVQTVSVPIKIASNPGFASFTIDVKYDNTYLTPVSVTATSNILGGYLVSNPSYSEDTVRTAFATTSNLAFEGDLMYVNFTVSEDAEGVLPIDVSVDYLANELYEDIPNTDVDGRITIKRHAAVGSTKMVDTTDVEGPNKSITSFMTAINTNSESVNALTWSISYDGTTKSYVQEYDTVFTGTVKLGLYIENLYVEDESLLDVSVEIGKVE